MNRSSRIPQWEADKMEFEVNKTIQLQNDEIHRLRKELSILLNHISSAHDHFEQTKSIYLSRIKSLRQEIDSVPTTKNIVETRLLSEHTKAINFVRNNQSKRLNSVRMEYANNFSLFNDSLSDIKKKDEMLSNIGSTREKIADFLSPKLVPQEKDVQSKLNQIIIQIDQDRARAKYLQKEIDKMKSDLEEARKISNSKQTDVILKSPLKLDFTRKQQKILDKTADAIAEENAYKQEAENHMEQTKSQIHETKTQTDRLKREITRIKTDAPPELENAFEELKALEETHREVTQNRKMLNDLKNSVLRTKKKKNRIEEQITFCSTDLNEAQKENLILIEELRRLDFMIYGRNGKYQCFKSAINYLKSDLNQNSKSIWPTPNRSSSPLRSPKSPTKISKSLTNSLKSKKSTVVHYF